jgi:hypothetical protein
MFCDLSNKSALIGLTIAFTLIRLASIHYGYLVYSKTMAKLIER